MTVEPRILERLHRDQRGALGILLVFTIFSLVAMIGLVWNAGEYAVRRRHVQTAADSAAQSASLWTARTSNIVAATNQLIVENASAEVIWRSVRDTIDGITRRLTSDVSRIEQEMERIATQRDQNNNRRGGPDPVQALKLDLKERVLREVLTSYPTQFAILDEFILRTASGMAGTSPEQLAARRAEIYDYQSRVIALTRPAVDEQRQAIATFYECDVTLGTPGGSPIAPAAKSVDHVNETGVTVAGVNVPDPAEQRDIWVTGGTWGEIVCPPLARFFNDRVDRDIGMDRPDSLIPILRFLDEVRRQVSELIAAILTPPPTATPEERRAYEQARAEIDRLNLGERFAVRTFTRAVSMHRRNVLWNLGEAPQHVLITYDQYNVPDWAKPGVYREAYDHVYNDVYNRNYNRLYRMRYNELRRAGAPDADARRLAAEWARAVADAGARLIAEMAATEWITRTWPYEITPPQLPVPPTRGISTDDRHRYFTLHAAARSTDQTAPRPFLAKMFDAVSRPMAAYAQAESFNWMEYNGGYGAGDRYDQRMPPRPWRVSTHGGWNWQPRLAFSDALDQALANNPEMRRFFEDSGVTSYDQQAIKYLTMH